ncbi:DUF4153 domain-containing protein [Actinoplanes sp. L3-i22]|uniref:DUF4153 domain-containing protein n=1 Tax=Actinoplanes sp. L3-i22 TaxID=2836373 RepID=UPI001C7465BE|nr:DUF4173 domain-containing protein [Actinoplanes sp. L3-i22]BCY15547.1 hypothetical protein L3i22_106350 [Actinoplanes sp. L3-i22]
MPINGQLHGPWPEWRPWRKRVPGPPRPASPRTLAAIAGAVAVAVLSFPLAQTGVGWLITAVAAAIALLVARPATSSVPVLVDRPAPRPRWDQYAWGAATIALLGVGTFRAAGWLFVLCVLTATLTFALAIGAGRSMRAVFTTYTIGPFAMLSALPWVVRGLARLRRPGKGGAGTVRIVATAAVSVVLLAVFGLLFASADAEFARVTSALVPDISVPGVFRWVFVSCLVTPVLAGAAYLRVAPPNLRDLDRTEGRKVNRLEWAVPLGLLTLLFAAFVTVQLTVLFGGEEYVRSTTGLTYAQYARGGFWQLCFIIGLTLAVLAGAARWAPREAPGDRVVFRAILGALTLLTLVIVASSLVRMQVYIDAYGLTRMRLLVACCEVWFGVILVLVLLAGIRIRAAWLPRAAIAAGVFALIGLAVANPDLLIARNQLDRSADRIDVGYLSTLSPDAVPAIAEMTDPVDRTCVLFQISLDLGEREWRTWNLGRETAAGLIGDNLYPMDPRSCSASRYGY